MEPAQPSNWGIKKLLWILGSTLLLIILWTYITSPMVVTVTGSGEVSVPATNATISFTLSANNNDSSGAVKDVRGKADTMENYLEAQGFAAGNIARSQVTVVPSSLVTAGGTGFQATISMAAKTTDISGITSLIPTLYSNGALVVAQPVLSVENQDALSQQSFNNAMKDANTQASRIASANFKLIRKIVSISQVSSPSTSTSTTKADVTNTNATAISNGVFKIVTAVSVSYKMW